ncbi:uncharacterized protein LOC121377684 [Gigantopelta aegis]|uniref:uncharacterized protein LOC121377684 n=1 Tax=Gigantopelta aegis TaxID=1735272 RepID=UPI001B88CA13|nr:uncharacterized protein LOC121377684 [Gigantopelta aegis]
MSSMEKNINDNFSSFLLFVLDDEKQALEKNTDVFNRDSSNIVACANRVCFLHQKDKYDAEEILRNLEKSKEQDESFRRMHAVAEAEMAYCLSRISPFNYSQAVKLYRSVNTKYPNEYLWMFREAKTLRRCVTLNSFSLDPTHDIIDCTIRCSELLNKLVEFAPEHDKAKAWVELGELNCLIEYDSALFKHIDTEMIKKRTKRVLPRVGLCYENALSLSMEDVYVLERSGRYFRFCGDLKKSKSLLTKAIGRRGTGFSHHHLALTLIEIAKADAGSLPINPNDKTSQCNVPIDFEVSTFNTIHNDTKALMVNSEPDITSQNLSPDSEDAFKSGSISFQYECYSGAIYHLTRSIEITRGCNIPAVHDLGFLYLKIKDYDKAEETFRKSIHIPESHGSPLLRVDAYEQTGLSCLRKSKDTDLTEEEKRSLRKEGMFFLTAAVERAAKLVAGVFCLNMTPYKHRQAFKTITELQHNEYSKSGDTKVLAEEARLYELVNKHSEALDIYEKLEDVEEEVKFEISIKLIKSYLAVREYDKAKLRLSLLLCTNEAGNIPPGLVISVYLKTACHLLKNGLKLELAHTCFNSVFEWKYGPRKHGEGNGFDVMILHDEQDAVTSEISNTVKCVLEKFTGLKITRNADEGCAADLEMTVYENLMSSARVIVIVLNSHPLHRLMNWLIQIAMAISLKEKNMLIVCLTAENTHSVNILRTFKSKQAPKTFNNEDAKINWLLDFFPMLVDFSAK